MVPRETSRTRLLLITSGVVWLSLFIPSAVAFFGSECNKPKASYEKYLDSARKLKIGEDQRKRLQQQREQQYAGAYERCQKNPNNFFRENFIDPNKYGIGDSVPFKCWYWYLDMTAVRVSLSTPSSFDEYKRAMQVVKSYKKCFDPEIYIGAIEWLRKNK